MSSTIKKPVLTPLGEYVTGVGADFAAVIATQPLDTLNTFIMNGGKLPPRSALLKGILPNLAGTVVQGGMPFLINSLIIRNIFGQKELSDREKVATGIMTAWPASAFICPFERVAKVHQKEGGTLAAAWKRSVSENGVRSLFKAALPIAMRDSIVFGSYFGGRKVIEGYLQLRIQDEETRQCAASVAAGVFAGSLSTFFQEVNVKMQADIKGEYPTFWKTTRKVVQDFTLKGFAKNAAARAAFMGPYYLALFRMSSFMQPNLPRHFYESS